MKKGEIIKLEIESVAHGSEGIGRLHGLVVFVPGALPGEKVRARIVQKRRDYLRARAEEFLQRSPHRTDAPCPHFPACGGCKWQDVDYSYQLELKREIVAETLTRLGGFTDVPVHGTLPSPEIFGYRNKMEFSFSAQRWILLGEPDPLPKPRDFALGFHVPGRFDKVLDIDRCWLQSDRGNGILTAVKRFALESGLPAWNARTHTGFWRFLVLREGKRTAQLMVNAVTSEHRPDLIARLARTLLERDPDITSIVNNTTTSVGGTAFGEREFPVHGPLTIQERLGDFVFEISANSFFQTNTLQAERLYARALEFARLSGSETVYDLYSGTGTISLFLSRKARLVVGIEVIPSAVADARRNAERNGVENCEFVAGDIAKEMKQADEIARRYGRPDVVVVDPPRAGVHPRGIRGILRLAPKRIVYVSCNPSTFARDARLLADSGYRLLQVQPVDMFPHTAHIELIAELERSSAALP